MISNRLILLALFLVLMGFGAPSFAQSKVDVFGWWHGHDEWADYSKFNGYLETGKDTQNQQWANEDWYVQDWVAQNKDAMTLVDGFFRTDIFREQGEEGGVPVVVVGPQFYRLGGFDKRRVMTTLDAVYRVTQDGTRPVIRLKDWYTKRDIGIFTKDGLQLE